jgi:hypothetical protein
MNHFPAVHPLAESYHWKFSMDIERGEAMRSVTLLERIGGGNLSNKTP